MATRDLVIGFDADDTLWHSEDSFHRVEARFAELVAPHAPEGVDVAGALRAMELAWPEPTFDVERERRRLEAEAPSLGGVA